MLVAFAVGSVVGAAVGGAVVDSDRPLRRIIVTADLAACGVAGAAFFAGASSAVAIACTGAGVAVAAAVGSNARVVLASRYFLEGTGQFAAWNTNMVATGQVVGSAVAVLAAGPVVAVADAYGTAALLALVSAALRVSLPAPPPGAPPLSKDDKVRPRRRRLAELRELSADPVVRLVLSVFALIQLSEAVAAKLFVPFVVDTLAASPRLVPGLELVAVAGGFVGAAAVAHVARGVPRHARIAGALAVLAASVTAFGVAPGPAWLFPLELLISASGTVAVALIVQLLVESVADSVRGRAFAMLTVVTNLGQVVSLLVLAVALAIVDLRAVFVLAGAPLLVAAALVARAGRRGSLAPTSVPKLSPN